MDQIQEGLEKLQIHDDGITGFIHCQDFDQHFSNKDHPEKPQRTQQIDKTICQFIAGSKLKDRIEEVSQFDGCSEENLLLVYQQNYINFVEGQFEEIEGMKQTKNVKYFSDTYMCKTSASTARKCVQAVLTGVDKVLTNKWRNGFCSVRPPGHHSGHKAQPNGFCIYNNVAIAARYARKVYGTKKILILDWDVHHCDGTEHLFYEDPDTLVVSIHRYDEGDFYPRSGDPEKTGGFHAQFKNINVGWNYTTHKVAPGYSDYVYAYNRLIGPIVKEFKPDFILISAGYDSAKGDPLGDIENTPEGYQYITQKLSEICPKVLAVLEGGYNIQVTAECALATFKQLLNLPNKFQQQIEPNICGISAVSTTIDKHKEFWKCLESEELLQYQKQYIGNTQDFISGGHLQSFKIMDDKLKKITKKGEFEFYNTLLDQKNPYYEENQRLLRFMPKLYSTNAEECSITLENLCHGLENASILDLKIGYKTYNPNGNALKREKEIKKASQCEQNIMGFRVAGVKVRDQIGAIIVNKNGSQAYKTITSHKLMKETITKVFQSNCVEEVNKQALQDTIKFIEDLISELQKSQRMFRNTSILIIVDNIAKQHRVKWIDFNYVMKLTDDIESPKEKSDLNLIGGLKYLVGMLRSIN